jgi:hypothetical protein
VLGERCSFFILVVTCFNIFQILSQTHLSLQYYIRVIEKNYRVSHDRYGSVGTTGLNVAVFDNCQISLLMVRGINMFFH